MIYSHGVRSVGTKTAPKFYGVVFHYIGGKLIVDYQSRRTFLIPTEALAKAAEWLGDNPDIESVYAGDV